MMKPDTKLVITMGVSGCGKSTVAQALADRLDLHYLEADDWHSDEAKKTMAQGIPLTDEQRVPWIASLCSQIKSKVEQGQSVVLACSALKAMHRDAFRALQVPLLFLHLRGSQAVIGARLNLRPNHFFPPALLKSQFEALEDPKEEADVVEINIEYDTNTVIAHACNATSGFLEHIHA